MGASELLLLLSKIEQSYEASNGEPLGLVTLLKKEDEVRDYVEFIIGSGHSESCTLDYSRC
jgi:hypothetical protein